ncbi:MAG: SDR family oxidoreductase [Micromonosporaceae bacterium]|nr:SDR family oxidoreductase [Micromonosporaceae bacterium]
MNLGISGRVALVAAATSGLGFAAARALAAEGAQVSICGRDQRRLAAARGQIAALGGGKVSASAVDVRDSAAVAAWVDATAAEFGELHIVVANSGGPAPGPVDVATPAAFRQAYEACVQPQIGLALAALPHLRAAGWGRILMIASETARQPIVGYGLSSTVRPALLGFARTLAHTIGGCGVTVNVLAPGYHRTPGLTSQFGEQSEFELRRIAAGIPVGRVGCAEDFGAVAAFLASERAGFITGTSLLVDGGAARGTG